MFHIKYPHERGFFTWDELGSLEADNVLDVFLFSKALSYFGGIQSKLRCLSRGLGFQTELFSSNVTEEIAWEENGLPTQEVNRMLDYSLLNKTLHLTVNIHTDTWNVAVFRKAVNLVDHRAFTFEQLHCIRVAYQLYENQDSKGLSLQQRVLLRTLKMCGRTIAPLKLMHRIKHMRGHFVESGRIQLDEFLDLTLWCDLYEDFNPDETEYAQGMDNELFQLVSFERLMSHHDGRLADRLNSEYLAEEWDFGRETLSSKWISKDPPVNNQYRLQQVQNQKEAYKPLNNEVSQSQHRVYRSRMGFVRPRPLTAPDLGRFSSGTAHSSSGEETVALGVYDIFQKLVNKTESSSAKGHVRHELSEPYRPVSSRRKPMASVVTQEEMADMENKMDDVVFQIETLEGRYQYDLELDREFLLPGYLRVPQKGKDTPDKTPQLLPKRRRKEPLKSTKVRIDQLVNPRPRSRKVHYRTCDARFRGWYSVGKDEGHHYILCSPTIARSPQAALHQRMFEQSSKWNLHLHDNFLYRHNVPSKNKPHTDRTKARRPHTAPRSSETGSVYSPMSSVRSTPVGSEDCERIDVTDIGTIDSSDSKQVCLDGLKATEPFSTKLRYCHGTEENQPGSNIISNNEGSRWETNASYVRPVKEDTSSVSEQKAFPQVESHISYSSKNTEPNISSNTISNTSYLHSSAGSYSIRPPVPFMKQAKASVVGVGGTGRIPLLEDSVESKYFESVVQGIDVKDACAEKCECTETSSTYLSKTDSRNNESKTSLPTENDKTLERESHGVNTDINQTHTSAETDVGHQKHQVLDLEEQRKRVMTKLRIYTHRS